jgi:hypothetical protein
VLRKRGEIIYTTKNHFQRWINIEEILKNTKMREILGEDHAFTLDGVLGDRLGANVRNNVAHGLLDDATSNSYETAYLWWLALNLLRLYGPDPLTAKDVAKIRLR